MQRSLEEAREPRSWTRPPRQGAAFPQLHWLHPSVRLHPLQFSTPSARISLCLPLLPASTLPLPGLSLCPLSLRCRRLQAAS